MRFQVVFSLRLRFISANYTFTFNASAEASLDLGVEKNGPSCRAERGGQIFVVPAGLDAVYRGRLRERLQLTVLFITARTSTTEIGKLLW